MIMPLYIGTRRVGEGEPCFIIAEAGTAHNGDLEKARALVESAKRAGADCVKFQVVYADEIVHPLSGEIELPGGKISIYERFKSLECNAVFYRSIKDFAEKEGLLFLATPFGAKSARLLRELGVSAVKIASPELNHYPLLDMIADFHVPVILSTGVSLLGDIEQALRRLGNDVVLLHCVTSYPAREEEYNVRLISLLSRLFGRIAGVSDHSPDPLLVPIASILQGACVIEKHITLSKEGGGLDDKIALSEEEFRGMVSAVREAEAQNKKTAERLLGKRYGKERVETVFGSGKKVLAPGEAQNYAATRRSILAVRDIKKGEPLSEQNIALLRSEKNLQPGLRPEFFSLVMGKIAQQDVPDGRGIMWEDLFSASV